MSLLKKMGHVPAGGRDVFRALRSKGPFLLILRATALLLGFLMQLTLTRWLGAEQYGSYVYILAIVSILAVVSKLGQDSAIARFGSAYNTLGDWKKLRGLVQAVVSYSILAGSFVASLFAVYVYLSFTMDTKKAYYLAALLIPLTALFQIRNATIQALKKPLESEIPEKILRPILVILLVLSFQYLALGDATKQAAIEIFTLATLVSFLAGWVLLVIVMPSQVKGVKAAFEHKMWLGAGLPFVLVHGVHVLMNSIDRIMLGNLDSMEAVGIYAVAYQVSNISAFGFYVVSAIASPYISGLFAKNDKEKLQQALTLIAKYTFVITLLIVLAIFIFHFPVLQIFGQKFLEGRFALFILMAGVLVNALCGMVIGVMNFSGKGMVVFRTLVISLLINIIINAILIPAFGILGAAFASFLSTSFLNLWLLYYVQRRLHLNPSLFWLIQPKSF